MDQQPDLCEDRKIIFYLHHPQEPLPKDPKTSLLPIPLVSLYLSFTTADATQDHDHRLSFSLLVAEPLTALPCSLSFTEFKIARVEETMKDTAAAQELPTDPSHCAITLLTPAYHF